MLRSLWELGFIGVRMFLSCLHLYGICIDHGSVFSFVLLVTNSFQLIKLNYSIHRIVARDSFLILLYATRNCHFDDIVR